MTPEHKRVTILLVEDDDGHARLLEKNLRRGGIINHLVRVADGQEAIDYVSRTGAYQDTSVYPDPSVVLLDVRMPRLDGFEVLLHLKSDPSLMKIPVIMLTSTDNQNEINRAYELGANGYVVKPVGMDSFIDRVVKLGMFIEVIELPENAGHTRHATERHSAC
ncbi:MAG TPA: response regulator [Candidatus Margulisiibacteriota bacterium]|nr:response regulator [Candidatus Margulisiibacteriota bacterium]